MNSEAYQSEGCVRLSLDITQLHSNQDSKEFYTFKALKQNLKFELLYRERSGHLFCRAQLMFTLLDLVTLSTTAVPIYYTRGAIYVYFRMSIL